MPLPNIFRSTDPASETFAIAAADADLSENARSLYVGGAGDLRITAIRDTDEEYTTFANVNAGSILPIQVKRVWSTGTTATNIIGLK